MALRPDGDEGFALFRKAIDELAGPDAPGLVGEARTVDLGWYVFGVVTAPGPVLPDELLGVDPRHAPLIVVEDDLAAVASQVPLTEFGEERLREHLEDPAWLRRRALTHDDVLVGVSALVTVVPMRLCTVYPTESALRRMLVRERAPLLEGLARFEGAAEWRVQVLAPEPVDREACGGAVHSRLAAVAEETALNVAHGSHPIDDVVLSGAYLVRHDAAPELHDAVAALRTEYEPLGLDLVSTGPWPPYAFVNGSIEMPW